jgi:hypothetical protein
MIAAANNTNITEGVVTCVSCDDGCLPLPHPMNPVSTDGHEDRRDPLRAHPRLFAASSSTAAQEIAPSS